MPHDPDFALVILGSEAVAANELAKFRDHWTARAGAGARKADWEATWRNWARRAAERLPRAGPNCLRAAPSRKTNLRMEAILESQSDANNGVNVHIPCL
jgi:hypothetical protein